MTGRRLDLRFDTGVAAAGPWAGLTDPSLLVQWWPEVAEVDLRVGGHFVMSWPSQGWRLSGRYRIIDPPTRLAFSWSWDHDDVPARDVEIEVGDGYIEISHEYGDDGERESYRDGWSYFVPRLIALGGQRQARYFLADS